MVIDPRRFRRGQAGQFVFSSRVVAVAAVAISGHLWTGSARAQLLVDPGGGFNSAWRYSASVGVDETWSDNINLAPAGQERSEFVTTISPSFAVTRTGSRLNLQFSYAPSYLYYANGTNGASLRNSLAATANLTVIENLLFFDASTSIAQANISPFGTQAAYTVNGSTNRAETRSYSFGPTLRSRLGDINYTLGYQFATSNSDSSAIAAGHTSSYFASAQTSTSFRDIGLGVNYNRTDQGYGGSNSISTESLSTTVTYVLQPTIHLRATAGYDRDDYPVAGQRGQSGVQYSGGFDWQPSHHTSVNVTYGHRYFGPTASISVAETTPRFSLSGSFSRDQTTSVGNGLTTTTNPNYVLIDQFLRATITDPAARAQAVTATLQQNGLPTSQFATNAFYSNQLYLSKSLSVALALIGLHNTVTFDVSRSESQGLSNLAVGFDVFNQAQRFRTTTYSANWSHPLGPRTTVNATAQKSKSEALEGSGNTQQRLLVASINRQFTKTLSGTALYRNTVQTGSGDNTGFYGGNYRENAVLGSLRVNF